MKATEKHLPLLLQNMLHTIHIIDADGCMRYITPSVEWVLGYRVEEVIGRQGHDFVHPDDLEAAETALRALVDHPGEERVVDLRLRHRDGSWRVFETVGRSSRTATGKPIVVVSSHDVTERRSIEAALRKSEERERAAREVAEAAERRARFLVQLSEVLDASLDYQTAFVNLARLFVPALADYCLIDEVSSDGGVRRIALAHRDPAKEGLLLRNHRHGPDVDPERHPVINVLRTGKPFLASEVSPQIFDYLTHDEPLRRDALRKLAPQSFLIVPLIARARNLGVITLVAAESGRRYGSEDLALAEEVARRAALAVDNARLYGEARRAAKTREDVLAFVSHDLRNSLATILLNASSVLESPATERLDPGDREQIEWIARASEQMNHLIEDLLDVTRIESGHLTVEPRPQPADLVVAEAHSTLQPIAKAKGVRLESWVETETPRVLADGGRVLQVFTNLVGNAIKFTPEGGSVTIRGGPHEDRACFSVQDTGIGISTDHLSHVFDRYWQAKHTRRGGTGLGLAISRGIVEAHGGELWAESTEGEGTTFYFTLPAASSRSGGAEPSSD